MSETNAATLPATASRPQSTGGPPIQRQFVNFAFYKLDPAFRRLPDADKRAAREEFANIINERHAGLICLSYSTVGLRPDCDLLLWRIGAGSDLFQEQTARINKTKLGGYLTTPWSFVSMTKRSQYIDKVDPFHTAESRTHIIPGKRKYLFVYPFVKTRDWYLLPIEQRQEIMDVHIKAGNKYPSVKLNTTYSFGLDDQDFVVAFETDEPKDFLDLVMELRETQSSKFTQRDTPIFTCVQMPIESVLDQLFNPAKWVATRIAILADVHVDGEGPRATLLAQAVQRIQSSNCDSVVLLGDTVERGQAAEYELVRSILRPIRSIARPMVGNHEVQEGTLAQFRTAWHVEPYTADLIENLPVMRFDTAIPSQPEEDYYGTVSDEQMQLCDAVLATRRGLPAIIFAHHPLANTVRRSDAKNWMIDNSPALRHLLERHAAPAIVFSGHTHAQSVHREDRLTAIGCPPLGYWPHAFLLAEISRESVRFETHRLIDSPADSPDPDASQPDASREEYRLMNQGSDSDRAGTVSFA